MMVMMMMMSVWLSTNYIRDALLRAFNVLFYIAEQFERTRHYSFPGYLSHMVSQNTLLGGGMFLSTGRVSAQPHGRVWRKVGQSSRLCTVKAGYVQ